jgi:DNA-binding response OmpR family regulator
MSIDILVIEDEKTLSELVRINLKLRGFSVDTASSGEEGLEIAYSQHPRLVLLDVRLPDINGWDICRRFKSNTNGWTPRVVFLTAAAQQTDRDKAKQVGGDGFLEKPFEIPELLRIVKESLLSPAD